MHEPNLFSSHETCLRTLSSGVLANVRAGKFNAHLSGGVLHTAAVIG